MGLNPDQLYERLLVTRCQAGDEQAFAELVGWYQPRLGYFIWKMLGRAEPVDDVLQDVWLDVLRGLPKLKDAGAFPAWAYRVARDRVYRELRRAAGPRGAVASLDESAEASDAAAAGAEDDGDDHEFSEQDVALVHACLDELSPRHREVLVLRFLQQMSYEEVADVARCEVGTVRSRLHYAKAALRSAMERKRSS